MNPWEKEIAKKAKEFERRKNLLLKKVSRNVHDASAQISNFKTTTRSGSKGTVHSL